MAFHGPWIHENFLAAPLCFDVEEYPKSHEAETGLEGVWVRVCKMCFSVFWEVTVTSAEVKTGTLIIQMSVNNNNDDGDDDDDDDNINNNNNNNNKMKYL